jgi:hypothetical protein
MLKSYFTPKELGTQVTLWDVIELWIGAEGVKTAVKTIVPIAIKHFISWAKKRRGKEMKPRGKSFTIYGPDGKIVSSTVLNEYGEVEDQTEKDKPYPPRRPKDTEPF